MNKIENSKIVLILSVLIIFIMMGAATAADDTISNENVSTPENGVDALNTDSVSVDEEVSAADTNNLIGSGDETFEELQNRINNLSDNEEIKLTQDYNATNGTYKDHIVQYYNTIGDSKSDSLYSYFFINKNNVTIDGGGHTIDGNARNLFFVGSNTKFTLKNINIINCAAAVRLTNSTWANILNVNFTQWKGVGITFNDLSSYGRADHCNFKDHYSPSIATRAIFTRGHGESKVIDGVTVWTLPVDNITITNCNFENISSPTRGVGVEVNSPYSLVENCTFKDNHARSNSVGGALDLYTTAIYSTVKNCTFINCTASNGGALGVEKLSCHNITIMDCSFINNTASNGGAVVFNAADSSLTNCSFIGNNASNGGAVVFNAPNSKIINCNFTNNTATNQGGAIYSNAEGSSVENATFTNNSASVGTDFYVTPRGTLDFIGLVFSSLWVNDTNNSDAGVNKGFGTSNEKPAIWTEELYSFLNTKNGAKTTIYIVGTVNSLDEKILKIPNLEIVGYDPVNNPGGAVIDMSNWTHRAFTTMAEHITFRNIKFTNLDNITVDGGVILANAAFTSIINCTFSDINVTGNGGAIYINKSVGSVQNSTFMNNNVTGSGASIYVNGASFVLSDSSFTNNKADGNGTVYVNKKESANILNSNFKNNHAYEGAGIYIKGNVFYNQENNTFTGNSIDSGVEDRINISDFEARKMLSHVYVNLTGTNTSDGTINDPMDLHTAFSAVNSNGIITFIDKTDKAVYKYSKYASVPLAKQGVIFDGQLGITTFVNIGFMTTEFSSGSCIYNLTFTNYTNTAIVCGGSDNYAVNCIFENNTAVCISNTGKNNRAINCTFKNNTVNNGVSCLEIKNGGFTNLTDCKFINNTHKTSVISILDGSCSIDNGTFTNNTGSSVGVLSNVNGTVSILDSRFNYNHGSDAGVIYNTNSTLTITGSEFNNNNATLGGAVYNNGTLTITGSEFNNNNATLGGAIYNDNGTLTIKDTSSFNGNNATLGGAIYNNAVLDITDSSFNDNNASKFGGAIFSNGNLTVSDSSFVGNNATLGGALFLNSTNNKITGVLFSGNRAVNGSAVYVNRTGSITLRNDTFKDNVASTNGTVYFNQDASIETTTAGDDLIFTNNIPEDDRFVFADNVNYTSNVLYVSSGGSGDGLTSANRANLTYALKHAAEDAIIYLEKGDYENVLEHINNQVTIVGNGSTVKGNKYLFILQVFK